MISSSASFILAVDQCEGRCRAGGCAGLIYEAWDGGAVRPTDRPTDRGRALAVLRGATSAVVKYLPIDTTGARLSDSYMHDRIRMLDDYCRPHRDRGNNRQLYDRAVTMRSQTH